MDDVTAGGIRVTVVAAKLPGEWILRAIDCFVEPGKLREWIEPYVALVADPDAIEWTMHIYHVPHYLAYGSGDVAPWGWPEAGVFVFEHGGDDHYGHARQLRDRDGRQFTGGRAVEREIDALRRWKDEAAPLLAQLDRCHELLPPHAQARLGYSKGAAVEHYIKAQS